MSSGNGCQTVIDFRKLNENHKINVFKIFFPIYVDTKSDIEDLSNIFNQKLFESDIKSRKINVLKSRIFWL